MWSPSASVIGDGGEAEWRYILNFDLSQQQKCKLLWHANITNFRKLNKQLARNVCAPHVIVYSIFLYAVLQERDGVPAWIIGDVVSGTCT